MTGVHEESRTNLDVNNTLTSDAKSHKISKVSLLRDQGTENNHGT